MKDRTCFLRRVVLVTFLSATGSVCHAQPAPEPAMPVEPITAIIEAFETHNVVALSEGGHTVTEGHEFRLSLIHDPRFSEVVDDIVVEWGNALYQEVMDRFIAGDEIAPEDFRVAWQNTTQPTHIWDVPIYEEFFHSVRALNATLPEDRQLRVLLGDPPIDWDQLGTYEELESFIGQRGTHPAELIEREVLAQQRRALVVYGGMHFLRRGITIGDFQSPPGIVAQLESAGASVMSIWTAADDAGTRRLRDLQPNVASWPVPSLSFIRGTVLGAAPFTDYYAPADFPLDGGSMEEQTDAILYIGPTRTSSRISIELCNDPEYMEMRMSRLNSYPPPGQPDPGASLREHCDSLREQ